MNAGRMAGWSHSSPTPGPFRAPSPAAPPRSRDRRGRGLRAPLLPHNLPAWTTKSQGFDAVVLEAFAPIDAALHDRLTGLDIAIDPVPRIQPRDPYSVTWPPEVTADGPVPLARLIPAGIDKRGGTTRARIVLFRRPLELRAKTSIELLALVHEVLVQQVATYLGVDEDSLEI